MKPINAIFFILISLLSIGKSFAIDECPAGVIGKKWRAKAILSIAIQNADNNNDREKLEQVYNFLNEISDDQINCPAANEDYVTCKKTGALAFVDEGDRKIRICSRLLNQHEDWIDQILIHESVHALGNFNECDAAYVEYLAMKLSGVGLSYRTTYERNCRLP